MTKAEIQYLKKDKKPIATLSPSEKVLGGSYASINPKRQLAKKTPKKTFLQKLFS